MPDDPDDWSRPRVAAGVLFFDEQDRILLVKPTYKDGWDIPGGYVNYGETPCAGAVREVKEELGIEVDVGDPLVIDWAPHPAEGDKILFVFDGGILAADMQAHIRLDEELSEYRFLDTEAALDALIPRLARRVDWSIRARIASTTQYLENGTTQGG